MTASGRTFASSRASAGNRSLAPRRISRTRFRPRHLLPDILRARIFAIACGYEDADDLDRLRFDPAFKLACGRLPDTGRTRFSRSRYENSSPRTLFCSPHPFPQRATAPRESRQRIKRYGLFNGLFGASQSLEDLITG